MISKLLTASAAALCTLAFVSFAAPSAQAGQFCSTDSSGMRGCGYETLAQCQATQAGKNGTCAPDPFYQNPKNALAYSPTQGRAHHVVKH